MTSQLSKSAAKILTGASLKCILHEYCIFSLWEPMSMGPENKRIYKIEFLGEGSVSKSEQLVGCIAIEKSRQR